MDGKESIPKSSFHILRCHLLCYKKLPVSTSTPCGSFDFLSKFCSRALDTQFSLLIRWADSAFQKSLNQPVLPFAIIAVNALEGAPVSKRSQPKRWAKDVLHAQGLILIAIALGSKFWVLGCRFHNPWPVGQTCKWYQNRPRAAWAGQPMEFTRQKY